VLAHVLRNEPVYLLGTESLAIAFLANEFYSLHTVSSLLREDNAHRAYFKSVASLNLIAVVDLTSQAHSAIVGQLAVGKSKAAGVLRPIALYDDGLKLRFLLLFECFEQCGNLLPGNTSWIDDANAFFALAICRGVEDIEGQRT